MFSSPGKAGEGNGGLRYCVIGDGFETHVVAVGIVRAEKQSSIYFLETTFAKFNSRELLQFLEA